MKINFVVDKNNIRLDKFLVEKLFPKSRSYIQNLIKTGKIRLNGKKVKSSIKISIGEEITGTILVSKESIIKKQNIPLNIIYEDDDIIIINKPSGLIVHPGNGNRDSTLLNGLLYHFKKLSKIDPKRPGIIHRLDKDTSGIIIIAKNDFSHLKLSKQFEKRLVKKEYKAIVWGKINKEGIIEGLIKRDEKNRIKFKLNSTNGKFSKTVFVREKYLPPFSFVKLFPVTGRTHQIRVHLSSIGHPIVNDVLYGGDSKQISSFHSKYSSLCKKILKKTERLALHAYKIKLIHPSLEIEKEWKAPIPIQLIEI